MAYSTVVTLSTWRAAAAGLLLAACASETSQRADGSAPGTLFLHGAEQIGDALHVALVGPDLAVWDQGARSLRFFDRSTGAFKSEFGGQGSGPGEFDVVWTVQGYALGDAPAAWAYDFSHNRLTGVGRHEASSAGLLASPITPQVPGRVLSIQWATDSLLVAVGFFVEGRYALVDPRGHLLRFLGETPLASDRVPVFAAQQALQPTLAIRPGGDSIAIAARYAARVDLYDTRTGALVSARVPIPFEPEFRVRGRGQMPVFESNENTRFGYIWITATSKRVYALFSGRTRAEYPGRASVGRQVHVFGWDGSYVSSVALNEDTIEIAVDSAGSVLFALQRDPEPEVTTYRLQGGSQ